MRIYKKIIIFSIEFMCKVGLRENTVEGSHCHTNIKMWIVDEIENCLHKYFYKRIISVNNLFLLQFPSV